MFIHSINPVLLNLGPVQIRWYGLIYALGFVFVYYILNKRKHELNLKKDDVETFILYLAIFIVLGARLFEVLVWAPGYYFSNPAKILAIWEGGLSLHGGLLGAVAVIYYFSKKHSIKFMKMMDIVTLPALFGLALGRIANFINGELVGTITNVPWCVKFPDYDGCRHPVQLYGALGRFALFGFLMHIRKLKQWKDGFIFWVFILLMGIGRFICDFVRQDPLFLGLSTGQYLSLAMFVIAGIVLLKYYRKSST